jgi:hypothetical protein
MLPLPRRHGRRPDGGNQHQCIDLEFPVPQVFQRLAQGKTATTGIGGQIGRKR